MHKGAPMLSRRLFLSSAISTPIALTLATPARATSPAIFSRRGIAINGYDPVAYFISSEPVRGNPDLTVDWKNVTWQFSNLENKDIFLSNPKGYVPQYGGYCAYAAAHNEVASTTAQAWTVYQGRLYLNYSLDVRDLWQRDIPGHIMRANSNWPAILQG